MAVNILDGGSTKYVFASKGIHAEQQQKRFHFEKKVSYPFRSEISMEQKKTKYLYYFKMISPSRLFSLGVNGPLTLIKQDAFH